MNEERSKYLKGLKKIGQKIQKLVKIQQKAS